jgi:hypothetical protein
MQTPPGDRRGHMSHLEQSDSEVGPQAEQNVVHQLERLHIGCCEIYIIRLYSICQRTSASLSLRRWPAQLSGYILDGVALGEIRIRNEHCKMTPGRWNTRRLSLEVPCLRGHSCLSPVTLNAEHMLLPIRRLKPVATWRRKSTIERIVKYKSVRMI